MANLQSATSTSEPQSQNQSAMPIPVLEYVNKYTDEAVKNGLAPKPPPPITDTYHMFGQTCHQDDVIIRPLEKQGIKRLHPENYKKKDELKKITISILCNFLDLLDILVKCGLSPVRDEKIEDLNLLFIHMHHLINEFRPHQARETLKVMMSLQKKNLMEAGDCLGKNIEKASEILKQSSEEVNSLIAKHKEAVRSNSSQEEMMDIDHILTSNTSAVSAKSSETRTAQFESSQDKDMLLCNLLDNIKE